MAIACLKFRFEGLLPPYISSQMYAQNQDMFDIPGKESSVCWTKQACMCVCMCVCVSVCVRWCLCVKELRREGEIESQRERACVCVFVCERVRVKGFSATFWDPFIGGRENWTVTQPLH